MHEHAKGKKGQQNSHEQHDNGFFQKLRGNHFFMIMLCILPILIMLAGSFYFGWLSYNLLVFVFLIACIISHIFMMKGRNHGTNHN